MKEPSKTESKTKWGKCHRSIFEEGTKPTILECRQLVLGESVTCPRTNKVWIGIKGDWVVRMPSGERPDAFRKDPKDKDKPLMTEVKGHCYIIKEAVFHASYVESK